jgi:hypothetical protein
MSLAEIEAELEKLTPDELRRLALKSWTVFVAKEGRIDPAAECSEEDARLLAALDQAVVDADSTLGQGHTAAAARARLREWTSR